MVGWWKWFVKIRRGTRNWSRKEVGIGDGEVKKETQTHLTSSFHITYNSRHHSSSTQHPNQSTQQHPNSHPIVIQHPQQIRDHIAHQSNSNPKTSSNINSKTHQATKFTIASFASFTILRILHKTYPHPSQTHPHPSNVSASFTNVSTSFTKSSRILQSYPSHSLLESNRQTIRYSCPTSKISPKTSPNVAQRAKLKAHPNKKVIRTKFEHSRPSRSRCLTRW